LPWALGLTRRKTGNLRTALEVTRAFAAVCPNDPVRYDVRPCEFLAHL